MIGYHIKDGIDGYEILVMELKMSIYVERRFNFVVCQSSEKERRALILITSYCVAQLVIQIFMSLSVTSRF